MKNKENTMKNPLNTKRKLKDILRNVLTWVCSLITFGLLLHIVIYISINGFSNLSWDFITSDYNEENYQLHLRTDFKFDDDLRTFDFKDNSSDVKKSEIWGVSFKETKTNEGEKVIKINEICSNSYFNELLDTDNNIFTFSKDTYVYYLYIVDSTGEEIACNKKDIDKFVSTLDSATTIDAMSLRTFGGGIRSSLLTTFALIGLTLLISLPIGIGGAIYFTLFSKNNKFNKIIRSFIDMTSAIPSIIFGFLGILIFIPFINAAAGSNGSSILASSLTLAVMLIPTIVKTTEEAINALPKGYMDSSLALGASRTETVFKLILPNAFPGILTAIILSVGRIIGESAALIFVLGTSCNDNVILNQSGTSLSTHIWMLLNNSETPNYSAACTIALIILIIVLILSLIAKLIQIKFVKKGVKKWKKK